MLKGWSCVALPLPPSPFPNCIKSLVTFENWYYLLKNTPPQQIAAAIRTLYQGHCQLDSAIAAKVFAQLKPPVEIRQQNYQTFFSDCPKGLASHRATAQLSDRELEILKLLGRGQNNREISQILHLTEGTLKNYITNIFCQLGVRDRTQAALWAKQNLW